jgi:S-formylglutathione hydrolase FrmB
MKNVYTLFVLILAARLLQAQINVFDTSFYSVSLDDTMPVKVYLPPGYDDHPDLYYPVIYILPSWNGSISELNGMLNLAEQYINDGTIDPVIMISAFNTPPPFEGNMYVNSVIWGDYEDYNVNDVVGWVESNFRAMPYRDYRALLGHSMGAHGAFRYAILYKEKFKALAAHAAIVTSDEDLWLESCRQMVILEHPGTSPYSYDYSTDGIFTQGTFLLSAAWTPNLTSPQTYINPQIVDFLFDEYIQFIDSTKQAWHAFDISHLLLQLAPVDSTGIFFGCGSSDQLLLYPANIALKDTLDMLGLPYEFYDHIGGHVMPFGFKARALTFLDSLMMPPDFNTSIMINQKGEKLSIVNIFPNPFHQVATVNFDMPATGSVELKVFNQLGQVMSILAEGQFSKGKNQLYYETSSIPAGIYFLRLQQGNEVETKKIIKVD